MRTTGTSTAIRRTCIALAFVAIGVALSACAQPRYLHSLLTPQEVSRRVLERTSEGMTLDELKSALRAAGVSERWWFEYEATDERPRVFLARLYPPGGFSIDETDEMLRWVDLSYVIGKDGRVQRILKYRDAVRYYSNRPVYGPTREPIEKLRPYPFTIPPPADPLQGAEPVRG